MPLPPADSAAEREGRMIHRREQWAAYLFLTPSFAAFLVFVLVPVVIGFGLSFFQWDLVSAVRFVGLENWNHLLARKDVMISFFNTIWIVALSLPLTVVIGLALALLVHKLPFGKVVFRSAFFAPSVTSLVAMSIIWRNMYATDTGLLNYLMGWFGVSPIGWLDNSTSALISAVVFGVWHSAGYNMLIFLAGLQGIDETYYEAARVDGAGAFRTLWSITLPLLTPTLFFIVITTVINGLQTFESVYLLTGGGPGYATTTLVYSVVNAAFTAFDTGLAASISVLLFLLVMIATIIQWKFQNRWVHYN